MNGAGALVYVVEDDPSAREGVVALIRSAGLTAKSFASAEEFLAAPRPKMPACLVLDVSLPGVSGLDLQQELAESGVQIPIIFGECQYDPCRCANHRRNTPGSSRNDSRRQISRGPVLSIGRISD